MFNQHRRHADSLQVEQPNHDEVIRYMQGLRKDTVFDRLQVARKQGNLLVQPRCGVGDHQAMLQLLGELEAHAGPDVATLTIDAHTRLKRFEVAARLAKQDPKQLNGYPLPAHGWRAGRELNESIVAPIQIRHGSPDPRLLFEVSIAAGFSAFEGGGIGYNIPYCKEVPLQDSLNWWREVDRCCGELARHGIIVDREFFGTLTAVLMPPTIQLAVAFLEALLAYQSGVKCLSIAVCQTGHTIQDISMLRAIPLLARRYLPEVAEQVYPVLHQFMGAFPMPRQDADALILRGAMIAKAGGAVKTINKTHQESFGVPTREANVSGILLSKAANSWILDLMQVGEESISAELEWLLEEVDAVLAPVLDSSDLLQSICTSFANGRLDVPFSASRYAKAQVMPMRAADGAIRFFDFGQLNIPHKLRRRHQQQLGHIADDDVFYKLEADIMWFCRQRSAEDVATSPSQLPNVA
ncbi:hypothetical protein VI06_16370 [Aquitalea magnusonii]|nr:hypothetical protein VI06_16370 [Aquitalea magnusonii]